MWESGALLRWLGHEGRALTNGISSLLKETPNTSLTPAYEDTEDNPLFVNQETGPQQTLNLPGADLRTLRLQKYEK